ncbi:alpha/beta hydrolase [Flavobacteriaceae bacterium 3-367]|uniref:alpha/beta fold hydrolase n=1 Tax=Eudoraea algarum TaxID=3417568 RepID=UPI0032754246
MKMKQLVDEKFNSLIKLIVFSFIIGISANSCINQSSKNKNNQMNVMDSTETKENILFIHGFPMSSSIWKSQVSALNKDYNCYAIDLPGYGKNLSQYEFNHSINSYSDYVYQYINDNNLAPVHIVGMSMGGSITLNMSRRYNNILKSMTVIHTSAIIDTDEDKRKRDITIAGIEKGGLLEFIDDFADRLLSPKSKDEIRQKYICQMREASQEVVIAGYKAIRNREDESSNLSNLKIPVLVVAGNDDIGSTPEEMKEIAEAIPNSTFKIISDCGHVAPLEQPQRLNEILSEWYNNIINVEKP